MAISLKVLILEDRPDDAEIIVRELHQSGFEPEWQRLETEAGFLAHLEPVPDVILADYTMPHFSALRALQLLQARELDIPFIVLTGSISEEAAVACMRQGASDYLLKDRLARLGPAVTHALEQKKSRDEHRQVQSQLQKLSLAVSYSPVAVLIYDNKGTIEYVNPKFTLMTGYELDEVVGHHVSTLGYNADVNQRILEAIATGREWREELIHRKKNGEGYWASISISPIKDERGDISHFVEMREDITARKQAEKQIRQQDRLAVVGQLAAGIAHDFNNIMAVITLYSQLLLKSDNLTKKEQERLRTIYQQANRAADLTAQILDFSRQSVIERHPVELKPFLKELVKLLRRTLPESIDFQLTHGDEQSLVSADLSRLQQLFMNLAVNARDAMPDGGTLQIGLATVTVRSHFHRNLRPGQWIEIRVSDSGTGIRPEHLSQIFEPFFSTKAPGQGTGLGLAQVYGIVKQHDGHIEVASQPGKGTSFTIYLPALVASPVEPAAAQPAIEAQGREETILVVEDDAVMREAIAEMLEMLNYKVITASEGQNALILFEQHADEIKVVLSDMVMPVMSGESLYRELKQLRPDVKVILTTGYPLREKEKALLTQGLVAWIQKPFGVEQLSAAIQEALAT